MSAHSTANERDGEYTRDSYTLLPFNRPVRNAMGYLLSTAHLGNVGGRFAVFPEGVRAMLVIIAMYA